MAKISISLPDALKERLDAYALAHNQSVSESVQKALEQLLDGSPPPTPPTPPAPPVTSVDQLVRKYVQDLVLQVELMRRSMQGAMLPVPYPLPAPPWYQPWTTGESWPPATQLKLLPPPEG